MKSFIKQTIFLFAGVSLFTSCGEDTLDLAPVSAIGENGFYTNTDEVEGGVLAIYDGLQNLPSREFALTEMRSDNTETKASEGDWAEFESFNVLPTNQAIGNYWVDAYNVIFRANRVLENLEVVTIPSFKTQFEGEAKFGRALGHFKLVRGYGNVPLVDKVISQEETDYFDNDTPETVYTAIIADLRDAANLLPDSMPFGRATKGAAQGLLAKVLLTRGDYAGAKSLLDEVISSGNYVLLDDYREVFYNEGNDEILFAIPFLDDDVTESQDFSFEMTIGGVRSGLNFLTTDLVAAIEPEDEERAAVLINPLVNGESAKFLTQSENVRLCGNDWIELRYADILLMQAEAILAGNSETTDATAIGAYNAVRARVGLSTLEADDELTKDMLLQERRIELAIENHRLYDLVRFGRADEVLSAFASLSGNTYGPTDILLPIPQAQINVSEGLLKQNPGY